MIDYTLIRITVKVSDPCGLTCMVTGVRVPGSYVIQNKVMYGSSPPMAQSAYEYVLTLNVLMPQK